MDKENTFLFGKKIYSVMRKNKISGKFMELENILTGVT